MVTKKSWLLALFTSLLFLGCQKENTEMAAANNESIILTERVACSDVAKDLAYVNAVIDPVTGVSPADIFGSITVTESGTDLVVTITAKPGYFIQSANVAYGTQAGVNTTVSSWTPCNGSGQFNANYPYDGSGGGQTTVSFILPETVLDAEGCVWFAANVMFYDLQSTFRCTYGYPADAPAQQVWKGLFQYCRCDPPPPDCGQLRTQTPGGWGAPPNGNNPGMYLHTNFAAAFPAGVMIGSTTGFSAKWTTAQAITNYLPAGGQAKKLTQNYLNPSTTQLKNTLAMHLLALTLSVNFDANDPGFGDAGILLNDMLIGSGSFATWTVGAFLEEANKVIAGTSNAYTVQQVLNTAAAINENYVDGNSDNGFLDCP